MTEERKPTSLDRRIIACLDAASELIDQARHRDVHGEKLADYGQARRNCVVAIDRLKEVVSALEAPNDRI